MKLTYFSEQTCPKQMGGGKRKLPKVSFGKNGVILFNPSACEMIGLKIGDKVTLAQDPDEPENWYFFKDKENGFGLRVSGKGGALAFNHHVLVKMMMEVIGREVEKTHCLKMAGLPTSMTGSKVQYWGILI